MLRKGLAGVLGVLFGIGFYACTGMLLPAHQMLEQPAPMRQSAMKLPAGQIHIVDPTPVRLLIPAINLDARIEARGLDAKRSLDTPKDFHDVAWYRLGPKPGDPGNAVMNGHVNWWTGDAVFTHLSRLRAGDEVRVVRADGGVVVFKVTGKSTVAANARVASLFAPSAQATLTLITCTGIWNPLTQSDTQRLLVSAALA
jgi:LPXTG-site transpeptidase (sortase) family protein